MRKKISIQGFYGMGNLGDEAILNSLYGEIEQVSNLRLVVFSRKPSRVITEHNVKAISSQSKMSYFQRLFEIKTSEIFVLGGGGLLKDYGKTPSSLKGWLSLLKIAKRLRVKRAVFCVGVENIRFEESKKALAETLETVELIIVRDRGSKRLLEEVGITNEIKISTDPAVLLGRPRIRTLDPSTPIRVMFCLRHWFSSGQFIEDPNTEEKLIASLAQLADFLIQRHSVQVEFVPLRIVSYDDDRIAAQRVIEAMAHGDVVKSHQALPSIQGFTQMVDRCSIVVGMRLHSVILATAFGVPTIAIEYMAKVRHYMESISQSKYCLRPKNASGDKLISLLEEMLVTYEPRSMEMCNEISKLTTLARNSILELVRLAEDN